LYNCRLTVTWNNKDPRVKIYIKKYLAVLKDGFELQSWKVFHQKKELNMNHPSYWTTISAVDQVGAVDEPCFNSYFKKSPSLDHCNIYCIMFEEI
jgi:hypothetical protein